MIKGCAVANVAKIATFQPASGTRLLLLGKDFRSVSLHTPERSSGGNLICTDDADSRNWALRVSGDQGDNEGSALWNAP
jgi:hypothetical protein